MNTSPAALRHVARASEVEPIVREAIATVLELEPDAVGLDVSLQTDLGAESLDYLDISFILEKKFGVRLPRVNLLREAEQQFGGPGSLMKDGTMTELGLRVLRAMRPEIDPSYFSTGLRASDAGRLLTARTFVRVVDRLLEAKEALRSSITPCPDCHSERVEASPVAPELTCLGCERVWPLPPGDDVLIADLAALHLELERA